MKVVVFGDIVGSPGRKALKALLPRVMDEWAYDFCIVNAENAAGGSGITPEIAKDILGYGVDVLSSGDHIWKKKEITDFIKHEKRLLRPINYPASSPGRGSVILKSRKGVSVGVINALGRIFMNPVDCPFRAVMDEVKAIREETPIIFVDFHAEATSEKVAMGWHLDGYVSCMFGTHTHIQTADETILHKGTAYITDIGMTGPYDSVIGRNKERVLRSLISRMPERFDVATHDVRLCGICVELDDNSGKTLSIQRLNYAYH